ncbi:nitrate ABC transporter ATP-binding protein [Paenibacillus yonginensis]|uniref:Nitrate ABC transporter ATP-binding protein n=1 Tax=Paenibacillus yonginensis TaxID=1462996 RepID=A0A1B1MYI3_9BACL|nr:ABC transporter ATP-binding protein [Paenibacillus yonginensis]ANS74244.1 nitrate ABC transporter ATP-binding protein [Paenibacillus yonginensis]
MSIKETAGLPCLSVQELSYAFAKDKPLFCKLSFDLAEGEFVSLLAQSGMGKTTLFRLIAGLLKPQKGEIYAPKQQIGYMPQRDCLMPWRSVLDNAAVGLEVKGLSKREARRQAFELLPEFGLEGTERRMPHELSGGMRQRVSFMRSLLAGGRLLLLDEPFSALDAMTRISMQEWLLQIWEKHRPTILFITHDVDEALLLSDRLLIASHAPVSRLHGLKVGQPRPRSYETLLTPPFIDLKQRVLELLRPGMPSPEGASAHKEGWE